jgi:2-polyprenyl-3-methyl-5-hydroxy-6-metoxy-1,4-benzoquinol methylase
MKQIARSAAEWPWRLLPRRLRHALLKSGVYAAAASEPATALRELLELESVVSGQIDLASMRYGDGVHVKHRLMAYHDFFVSRIHANERVLDVGCGYGAVAHSIAERSGASVVGIDLSDANVAQARRMFPRANLSFTRGEAPRDLTQEHFDVVVLSNVLEHIEDRARFLKEIRQKTTASRLLIRVPMRDRDWHVPLRAELGLFAFSDPTHFTEYSRETFESEMAVAGLSITHLQINWGEIWAEVRSSA